MSHTGFSRRVRVPEDRGVGERCGSLVACQALATVAHARRGDALYFRELRPGPREIAAGDEVLPAGRAPGARIGPGHLRASRDVPGLDAEARHGGHEAQRFESASFRLLTSLIRLVAISLPREWFHFRF